jgi:hypothetical protein
MLRKTLWIAFHHEPDDLVRTATYIGASAIAVRTANPLGREVIQNIILQA